MHANNVALTYNSILFKILVVGTQSPILESRAPDGLPLHEHIASKKMPQKKEDQFEKYEDDDEAPRVNQTSKTPSIPTVT
jgi:hypothetical protein